MAWLRVVPLAVAMALIPVLPAGMSQSSPAAPLAWVVSGHERVVDQDLTQFGEIVILGGGVLELVGTRVTFEITPPYEPRITIQSGGALYLNGTDGRKAALLRHQVVPNQLGDLTTYRYQIKVDEGGFLSGDSCEISGTGSNHNFQYPPSPLNEGFTIHGRLVLKDCAIGNIGWRVHAVGADLTLSQVHLMAHLNAAESTVRMEGLVSHGQSIAIVHGSILVGSNLAFIDYSDSIEVNGLIVSNATAKIGNMYFLGPTLRDDTAGLEIWEGTVEAEDVTILQAGVGIRMTGSTLIGTNVSVSGSRDQGAGAIDLNGWRASGKDKPSTLFLTNSSIQHKGADIVWSEGSRIHLRGTALSGFAYAQGGIRSTTTGAAQAEAFVRIIVTDGNNTPLPQRSVSLTSAGRSLTLVTDANGTASAFLPVSTEKNGLWQYENMHWTIRAEGQTKQVQLWPPTSYTIEFREEPATTSPPPSHPAVAPLPLLALLLVALIRRRRKLSR
jgi:MYXO-CTERM domain-containing protein